MNAQHHYNQLLACMEFNRTMLAGGVNNEKEIFLLSLMEAQAESLEFFRNLLLTAAK